MRAAGPPSPPRRVFVTGMGAVTPFGLGVEVLWERMAAGANGVKPVTRFDAGQFTCRVGGFMPDDVDYDALVAPAMQRKMDPFQVYALAAANLALEHGRLDPQAVDRTRFGVLAGSSIGGVESGLDNYAIFREKGWRGISPFTAARYTVNGVAAWPAIQHGLMGPNEAFSVTCASSSAAIGNAFRKVRDGYADRLLAGGSDSLDVLTLAFFHKARAVAKLGDDPFATDGLRPFSRDRSGTILAEGGGFLLLESEEAARERGAEVHAEVLGMGETCDGHNIVAPRLDGVPMMQAMRDCLTEARLDPSDVELVSAHGTGTPFNDSTEVGAIKEVLGDRAREIPVVAMKSQLGHTHGASGAIESMVAIMGSRAGVVTPTLHLEDPDPACDLDHVPLAARPYRYRTFLKNSFGFGGHNVTLAMRAGDPGA